jgi:hypothetical protein
MHEHQSYTTPVATTGGTLPGAIDLVHYGVAIPVTVGVDYRFLKYFAVGPSFEYAQVIAADG